MALIGNVRERQWSNVIGLLPLTPPYSVNVTDHSVSAESWIENYIDDVGHGGHTIISLPGGFQSYIHDSMLQYMKAEHVSMTALNAYSAGRATWSLVDVHHASLLHAKAIAAFFGLHVASFRKKSYIIDYFPQFGSKDHKRRFAKDYADYVEPVRLMKWTSDQVQQKDIWSIFARIAEICSFPDSRNSLLQFLRERKLGAHSPERNRVLYELAHWTFMDDLVQPSSNMNFVRTLKTDLDATDDYYSDVSIFERLRELSRSLAFDLSTKFFISDIRFGDIRSLPDSCFRCG